jgi:PAS domain S-box-containing protein
MKIRTRLGLNTWISLGVVILMMLSLVWSFREMDKAERNENLANEMRQAAFERIILRDEYLLYREKRAGIQWQEKSETLRGMLETAKEHFTDDEDKALLREVQQDFEATFSLFSMILEGHVREERAARKQLAFDERESRLIGQIFLKAYVLQDSMGKLYESTERAAQTARNRGVVLLIFFVVGGGMAIVVNSIVTGRIVSRRMSALHKGVEIIGGGNLDHRIETKGDDELADLASESNQMAASLKESLTSIDNLNREIAERRQADEALSENEEKFSKAFQTSPYAITITRVEDGRFINVNDTFTSLTGFTREEAAASSSVSLQLWVDEEDRRRVVSALLEGRDVVGQEFLFRRKNGEIITGSFSAQIFHLKKAPFILSSINDITERKRVENNMAALTLRQEAILAATPNIMMEVDHNKIYTWANPAGLHFFGEDVIGREAAYYFEGEQNTYDAVQPLFNGDENTIYLESWQRCKNGQKRLLAWWCRVLKDEKGNVRGALSSAFDITENKRAQEEIKKLNAELEDRVLQRTAQLEAINKELEAFAYSVSHDLRAPLRGIDGFSQALLEEYQDKPLDDTGKTYLERVRKATQKMGFLIDDILKLSRVTRSEFQYESIDLSYMVREIAEKVKKNNPERTVDVTVREGINVKGDPYMMRIAMDNLLDNAWKFTGKTEYPRIEFGSVDRDGETIYFIKDNGVGFDMVYVGKIFGAFQRLHATDEFPGTGIGLATVQRIIQRHGGHIWAEGEVGKGAAFYFTIA